MKRLLKYTLLSVFVVLVLAVATLAFVAATETGTRAAWNLARGFLPDGLKVAAVEGRLLGPLVIRGLDYRTPDFHLSVRAGELRWTSGDLWRERVLTVDLIGIDGVRYTQLRAAPPAPEKKSGPLRLPENIDLPLDVRLHKFRLQDVAYRTARDAKSVFLRNAVVSADYFGSQLTVDRLNIDAPLLTLNGRARIDASGPYPLNAALRWTARPPDYPAAHGRTTMTGALRDAVELKQSLQAPYRTQARVTVNKPLEKSAFDARLNLEQIDLRVIDKTLPPITLSMQAQAAGQPRDIALAVNTSVREPAYGTLNLALNGGFAGQRVTIDRLALSSPQRPARLDAQGTVALRGKQPEVDVEADWQALRWPLSGKAQIRSPKGRLSVDGTLDAARMKLAAALSGATLMQAGIKDTKTLNAIFRGGFADKVLTIGDLDVSLGEQRLIAQGRVVMAGKQPDLDVRANWQDLRWPLAGKPLLMSSPEGQVTLAGTPENLDARLSVGVGEKGRIEGNATRAGGRIDVALDWRELRWPLAGAARVISSHGTFDVRGRIENLRARLSARLAGPVFSSAGIEAEQQLRANFAGGLKDQIVHIERFALGLAEEKTELTAAGQVALKKQSKFDLDVGWQALRWPLAGPAQVESSTGKLTLDGPLEDVRARLSAALSGTTLMQAGIEQEQQVTLDFDGGFKNQVLTIDQFAAGLDEQQFSAQGRAVLKGEQPDLDMQAQWRQLRWPLAGDTMIASPDGEVVVRGTSENLRAQLNVGVGDDGRIQGRATRAGQNIDLALDWHELQWPMTDPQVKIPSGRLAVSGPLQDYQVKLNTEVDAPDLAGAAINVAGYGSLQFLDLTRIDIEALSGAIGGQARVAWKPALQAKVALDAQGLDPGELLADWPGTLGFRVRAQAAQAGDQLVATLEDLSIDGRLRDHPVQADARGAYDAQGIELETLNVASGESSLRAEGRVGDTLDLNWEIESPDLSQLLPAAAGEISGEGSAQGPLQRPRAEVSLTGSGLRYQTFQMQSLNLDANVDASGDRRSVVNLALDNGRSSDIRLKRITLAGEGTPLAHTVALTARTSTGNADVSLNGGLDDAWQSDQRWRFELDEATFKYPRLAPWALPEPITGMASAARATLTRGCWASGDARLCVHGERTPAQMSGAMELTDFAFGYVRRLLPPDTRVDGGLDLQARFSQPAQGQPAAQLRVQTTPGRVASVATIPAVTRAAGDGGGAAPSPAQVSTLLEFRSSEIDFDMSERGLALSVALRLAEQGNIEIMAAVPNGEEPLPRRPLEGRIRTNLPDLSFISQLTPDTGRFEGRVTGDMRLAGSLRAPELYGRSVLTDGQAVLHQPGLNLQDIRIALAGQGKDGVDLNAAVRSGGGLLNVNGAFQFADRNMPRAQISIDGHEFLAFNAMDARVFISPDLEVAANTGRVRVTGELHVPRASIRPKELPESAVSVSGDQVIVRPGEDEAETADAGGMKVSARIRLIVGPRVTDEIGEQITDKLDEPPVYIEAFGLTAGIEGELLIIEGPGEPTRGTGELNVVEGRYQAYGQDLIIETGRILFPGGPISEPGLDVRAIRGDLEDEDVVVGVEARGSLQKPKFQLFSEPSMPQQEQLSYLVLGNAPGESSGGESSLLARAALALGLKGGNYLAENFGSRLGVDEIGLESSDTGTGDGEQASLVIGKYLSPKLYLSYGIGLLEPVSTVRLEYSITRSLEFVTETSGAQTGGDVIYTIERGQ
ncbi:MAG: translocation/assembly module TamB domain-containing protein [Gammaproteobacteria bacterium]|nr:translocation/assembly module TamB domain-containing protein [Gammaproteobacteria bacterium]